MAARRGKLDIITEKLVSRKLLVLMLAVGFLGFGKIEGQNFVDIAMAYIGSQAIVDAVTTYKKKEDDVQPPVDAIE
jgi:hypothetical protein